MADGDGRREEVTGKIRGFKAWKDLLRWLLEDEGYDTRNGVASGS